MPLAPVTGSLKDIGLEPLAGFMPVLEFTPSTNAVSPGGTIVTTTPVRVVPSPSGAFTAQLVETAEFRPEMWFTLRIKLLDPDGGYIHADFPEWKIRVPLGGGPISSMIDQPPHTDDWWIGTTDPPTGTDYQWWIDTSGAYPLLKKAS